MQRIVRLTTMRLIRKVDVDMWTVFEETKLEGKIEGVIKMLRKYRESDDNILKELMSELGISEDEAEEYWIGIIRVFCNKVRHENSVPVGRGSFCYCSKGDIFN